MTEIHERTVTMFRALEYIDIDAGSLIESQLFHGDRADRYLPELAIRIAQFVDGGCVEDPAVRALSAFGKLS